jgi:hypothetical protein
VTNHRRPILGLALALAFATAACGGGSASNGPGGSAPASDTPASAGPTTDPGTPTEGPEATPAASQGGGGTATDACALITAEEAGTTLGADGETIGMSTPGEVSYCIYADASGASNLATSWMQRGGSGSFSLWKSGAGVQQVDGLGDDAVFDPSTASLIVLKGDGIISIAAGDGSDDEAQRLAWAKTLAGIALGRM